MIKTDCEFSKPIDLNLGKAVADWEFSVMECKTYETTTAPILISDGETFFNLYPAFSYADIIIIFFLISFLAIKIFSGIFNFVHIAIFRQKWL